jgi:hypothetical protein
MTTADAVFPLSTNWYFPNSPEYLERRKAVEALEQERDRLAAWKAEAMAVSAQCDIQAVGTLLKVPLGHLIHPAIEPGIRDLLAKLDMARTALESITHDMGASQNIHDLCALTLRQTQP